MMLNFFTERTYLPAGLPHITMLYPFWGKNPEPQGDPNAGRFDRLADNGRQFLSLTSLKDADVAILPFGWEHRAFSKEGIVLAEQLGQHAQAAGKPMALFFSSDSMKTLPNPHWLVFRTSLFRSRKSPNEFAMPAWSEDFVDRYLQGEGPVRRKRGKPVVGFCGFAPSRPMMLKRVALAARDYWRSRTTGADTRGRYVRAAAVRVLAESSRVETNFVLRDQFLGGALLPTGEPDWHVLAQSRKEYVENIRDSDYILCVRGAGNFSYRLYEALSCGRIPVFVDTDCLLPYHSAIAWKQHCVWVDHSELEQLPDKITQFHDALTDQQFIDLQRSCRDFWQTFLSPEGYFRNFYRHFQGAGEETRPTPSSERHADPKLRAFPKE